jgi:FkbM family methyltransferase
MTVILPEPVSTVIWRYGYFEADVCLYMLNVLKPGMTFIDIGAHFGFFTLLGSYLVGEEGRVLSLEPMPETYYQLKRNTTAVSNNLNIKIYNYAAYSENKKIRFYDYGLLGSAYNSVFKAREIEGISNSRHEIMVEARKVDDILSNEKIKEIDLIKIDAESSEMHVLRGVEKTLRKYRPKIIMEVGDLLIEGVPESKEIISWLQDLQYSPYDVRNGEIVPHITGNHYKHGNLLFINKEDNVQ